MGIRRRVGLSQADDPKRAEMPCTCDETSWNRSHADGTVPNFEGPSAIRPSKTAGV